MEIMYRMHQQWLGAVEMEKLFWKKNSLKEKKEKSVNEKNEKPRGCCSK